MGPPKHVDFQTNAPAGTDVNQPPMNPSPDTPLPLPPGFHATVGTVPEVAVDIPNAVGVAPTGNYPKVAAPVGNAPRNRERVKQLAQYILRSSAAVLALIAAVLMGTAKHTTEGFFGNKSIFGATKITQFQFFLAINVIACVYAAFSVGVIAFYKNAAVRTKQHMATYFGLADGAIVAFMFSAVGCAAAIDVLAKEGLAEELEFPIKICESMGDLCSQVDGAIAMSTMSAAAFLALALMSTIGIHS